MQMILEAQRQDTVSRVHLVNKGKGWGWGPGNTDVEGVSIKKKKRIQSKVKRFWEARRKPEERDITEAQRRNTTGRCPGHFPMPVWDHHISGEATKMFHPEKIKPQDRSGNKSRVGFLISAD